MDIGGTHQVTILALFDTVSRRVPSAGDEWHPYTFKPLPVRRGRFVGEVLLLVKHPGAIIPPTIDGVPSLHQIVGNISTRRMITRERRITGQLSRKYKKVKNYVPV